MKSNGLLYGPFTQALPNLRLTDAENRASLTADFTVPVEGLEAPWGMAQLVFEYDSARVAEPPRSLAALLDWARTHRALHLSGAAGLHRIDLSQAGALGPGRTSVASGPPDGLHEESEHMGEDIRPGQTVRDSSPLHLPQTVSRPCPTRRLLPRTLPRPWHARLGSPQVFEMIGAPGEIRTPNPQIRSLVLYPVELRAQPEAPGRAMAARRRGRKLHARGSGCNKTGRGSGAAPGRGTCRPA
jgi:hypothetical protein